MYSLLSLPLFWYIFTENTVEPKTPVLKTKLILGHHSSQQIITIISYVTNYSLILARNFSINLQFHCNFTCEITKLPWQPSAPLSVKMAMK